MRIRIPKESRLIPILVRIEHDNHIITLDEHQRMYDWHGDATLKYVLEYSEIGNTTKKAVEYDSARTTSNEIYFELSSSVALNTKNYRCAIRYEYGKVTDYLAEGFTMEVYDPLA